MTKTEISVAVLQGNQSGKDWNLDININVWENLDDADLEKIAEAIQSGEVDGDDPCSWYLLVNSNIQHAWDQQQLEVFEKKKTW